MNPLLLLSAILLPVVMGFASLRIPFRSSHTLHVYMESAAIATSLLVWILLFTVSRGNAVLYTFYPGFSLQFGLDGAGRLYAALVSLMWPLVHLYAFAYMEHDRRQRSFFSFYLMTYAATLGICFSGNLLTMYVFFELLSLSTLPLIAHYQNHESLFTARKYAAYLLSGAGLALGAVVVSGLYAQTGSFRYGGDLTGAFGQTGLLLLYLFGLFGFGMKAAVFPFHAWLPAASVAPTPVTALLHAVAVVNTGVFSVIRLTWYTYGPDMLAGTWVQSVCVIVAAFTLFFTSAMDVRERHVKRRLAWSTVSNLSYMLYGILLLTPAGYTAGLAHLVFHSLMKITLFLCIGSFMEETGKAYLAEVNGVGKRMPITFVFYTISALALMGMPLLCGFVSKWRLLMAGAEAATPVAYIGIAALIISAFLCAIYGLSVSVRAFFPIKGTDHYEGQKACKEGGWRMLFPMGVFTACQIVFGLYPAPLMAFLTKIGEGLL